MTVNRDRLVILDLDAFKPAGWDAGVNESSWLDAIATADAKQYEKYGGENPSGRVQLARWIAEEIRKQTSPSLAHRDWIVLDADQVRSDVTVTVLGTHKSPEFKLQWTGTGRMLEEIYQQIKPQQPPLEEPRELGAVVVDSSGWKWTRYSVRPGQAYPWITEGGGLGKWESIKEPRPAEETT